MPESVSPIFVVGSARSGTTLVARILGRHPHIWSGGEVHFFEDVYARRRQLGEGDEGAARAVFQRLSELYGRFNEPTSQEAVSRLLSDPSRARALERACSSYAGAFDAFMEMQRDDAGMPRWVNHVPRDIFYLDEIRSFFADARVVICVRDVRDYLLSYREKWRVSSPASAERIRRQYHPIVASLLWRSAMRCALAADSRDDAEAILRIRYEDLVREPRPQVERLCDFIDEPFDSQMLDVERRNSSFAEAPAGISASSVGHWRERLEPEAALWAQRVAARELELLGYDREPVAASALGMARVAAGLPLALWRGIRASRGTREPLAGFVRRRLPPPGTTTLRRGR